MPNITPSLTYRIPEELLDVANFLIVGARQVHENFKQRYETAQATIKEFGTDFWADIGHPASLQHGQKPRAAGVVCSDSRISLRELTGGNVGDRFGLKTVGGGVENRDVLPWAMMELAKHPIQSQEQMDNFMEAFRSRLNPNEMSGEAIEHVTYAHHLGVKKYLVLPHGRCGCVANAVNKAHETRLLYTATKEQIVLRLMYEQKKFLRESLDQNGMDHYVKRVVNTSDDEGAKRRLAGELAYGEHTANLVEKFIQDNLIPEDGSKPMRVVRGFFDVRSLNVFIEGEKGKPFVQLTHHQPFVGLREANGFHDHHAPEKPAKKEDPGQKGKGCSCSDPHP